MAFRALAPDLELITPIRELGLSRAQEMSFLAERGIHFPAKTGAYSINEGMWGTSVGGKETHDSWSHLPEAAYPAGVVPSDLKPRTLVLSFEKGRPVALDGKALSPVALIAELNAIGQPYGVGRGVHLGDTILGIKGRVGFDAPAAVMLITAHRELEKLVLSGKQLFWKETLGNLYGTLLHEGNFFDPLARDLEAFLQSSQARVTGEVRRHPAPARHGGGGRALAALADGREGGQLRRGQPSLDRRRGRGLRQGVRRGADPGPQGEAMKVHVDKVGSVTRNLRLGRTVHLTADIQAVEGAVIAARIHGEKSVYNELEDVHGRLVKLHGGDIVVGALGHRNALHGYEGVVPEKVTAGQRLHVLNMGGVIGQCTSHNPGVGTPFEAEVLGPGAHVPRVPVSRRAAGPRPRWSAEGLGAARDGAGGVRGGHLHERGEDVRRVRPGAPADAGGLPRGRRQAHRRVAHARHAEHAGLGRGRGDGLHRRGHRVHQPEDGGRRCRASSSPSWPPPTWTSSSRRRATASWASTACSPSSRTRRCASWAARGCCAPMIRWAPRAARSHLKEKYGIQVDVVAGPATDNRVGIRFVEREVGLPAHNARADAAGLGGLILEKLAPRIAGRKSA